MPQIQPSFALILTATIAPKGAARKELVRADPQLRLADYEAAIKFWLGLNAPWMSGIVFAENSGSSLDRLKRLVEKENTRSIPVDFLSYDYPANPAGLHYGYSEFLLLRQAVNESPIVSRSKYIIKATGRYRFPDISRLLRRLPPDFKVAIDCKCTNVFSVKRNYSALFGLAIFDRIYFRERLRSLPDEMAPAPPWTRRQFIEDMLYDVLIPEAHAEGIVLRWPCNCEAQGIGGNGNDYTTPSKRVKAALRAVGRIIVPRVWF